jgi:hypothetical protein
VTEHANSAMHGQRVSGGSLRANSGKRTGNTRAERAGRPGPMPQCHRQLARPWLAIRVPLCAEVMRRSLWEPTARFLSSGVRTRHEFARTLFAHGLDPSRSHMSGPGSFHAASGPGADNPIGIVSRFTLPLTSPRLAQRDRHFEPRPSREIE